ncbi:NAC domain-containing protein 40 isoform X2 [Arachis ipaensis]|uniref:NAC domain-containing protein 40 isoform X2 n=1 Tax=Arachis ipaensis TaxID=130454 RepID=UPI000A2B90EE|nr:NAC domain-containing protein 40 isoform X2 [Arachis ipaensis]
MVDRDSSEAHMSIAASSIFPGFRFCPTDEELISYYLRKKLDGDEDSVQVISELELCTFEPWDLPGKSFIQSDNEWFFFSPRGRKYPNGSQSKRATECGYWKATGKERVVKSGQNVIGTKRTLVFHLGRAPKGERTEWIMHEYCVNDKSQDSLVICRLKRNTEFRASDHSNRTSHDSDCGVSEGVTVQGDTYVPIQDKETGCSSKRTSSSNSSPSTTGQIESSHRVANEGNEANQANEANVANEINQVNEAIEANVANEVNIANEANQVNQANEANVANPRNHPQVNEEEDCYAEILNDDIIKLDESTLSRPSPPQGTANRRIRLRVPKSTVPKSRVPKSRVPTGNGCQCSKQSSNKINTFLSYPLVVFTFFVFTLLALGFFFIRRSQTTAQYSQDLSRV